MIFRQVSKLFSWLRGLIVQGPSCSKYAIFWWLYSTRSLRSKAAVCPYPIVRRLILEKSGVVLGKGAEVGFGVYVIGNSRKPPALTIR